MKASVINCSAPGYNLGAEKLKDYLREHGYHLVPLKEQPDLIALSVVFSWDAPKARDIALEWDNRAEIWAGGPGLFDWRMVKWWKKETGLDCTIGLDPRFERQDGIYLQTFASRGCPGMGTVEHPAPCWFCNVPRIEGKVFTLYHDFRPAPILCDNNLSALPSDFQSHIIKRYREEGAVLRDANSGFEPHSFDDGTYARWHKIMEHTKGWRLALDTVKELDAVERMLGILREHGEKPYRLRVYVLAGNEPIASCYERVMKVIEWGGQPHVQPVLPLNALDRHAYHILFDWDQQKLMDFARWATKWIWKTVPLKEYSNRKGERPPFADVAL